MFRSETIRLFVLFILAILESRYKWGYQGRRESDGSYTLEVPGKPGYVYVTMVGVNGKASIGEAFNSGAMPNPNLFVRMEYIRGILTITGPDPASAIRLLGRYASAASIPPGSSFVGSGSEDIVEGRRFLPGLLAPSDPAGLTVQIFPFMTPYGWYEGDTAFAIDDPTTANKRAWVRVAVDSSLTPQYILGSNEYDIGAGDLSESLIDGDAPLPLGWIEAGSVVVENGGTVTVDSQFADSRHHLAEQVAKNNYTATTDPTVNDDEGDGYSVTSLWFNLTTNVLWLCWDNSTGAAIWSTVNVSGIDFVSANVTNPPLLSELEDALGTPASIGNAARFLRDTGTDKAYLAISDSSELFFSPQSKPLLSEVIQLSTEGGWCWFTEPRALAYNGQTIFGYVEGATGSIVVLSFDHATRAITDTFTLHANLEIDDHDNPSFMVRDSDKRFLTFYSAHNGPTIYMRVSTNPEDISAWNAEVSLDSQLGATSYDYASPIQLLGETNDPIYLFFRHTSGGGRSFAWSVSTNDGATWAGYQNLLIHGVNNNRIIYTKHAQNGNSRIDFCCTDGNPYGDRPVSLYHYYYEGGNLYQSDGTLIGALGVDTPITIADVTLVYDGTWSTAGGSWIEDIAIGADGHPRVVFSVYETETDHRYYYGRWTGSAWVTNEITTAGSYIGTNAVAAGEVNYSGGITLDHDDPNVIIMSRQVSGQFEIFRGDTEDNGVTWTLTAITTASASKNLRPVIPRNHDATLWGIWMRGTYADSENWVLDAYGMSLENITHDHLTRVVGLTGDKADIDSLRGTLEELTLFFASDTSELGVYTPSDDTIHWISVAGTVTSVTASDPLSSTGGTTPNITHDTSGVAAGSYTFPSTIIVDTYGHITSAVSSGLILIGEALQDSNGDYLSDETGDILHGSG